MEECEHCGCELDDEQIEFAETTGIATCDECAEEHAHEHRAEWE